MSHSGNAEQSYPYRGCVNIKLSLSREGARGLTKMNPLPTRRPPSLRRVGLIMTKRQTNLNMEELRESYDQTSIFSISTRQELEQHTLLFDVKIFPSSLAASLVAIQNNCGYRNYLSSEGNEGDKSDEPCIHA